MGVAGWGFPLVRRAALSTVPISLAFVLISGAVLSRHRGGTCPPCAQGLSPVLVIGTRERPRSLELPVVGSPCDSNVPRMPAMCVDKWETVRSLAVPQPSCSNPEAR
jgi:hypothetical protein